MVDSILDQEWKNLLPDDEDEEEDDWFLDFDDDDLDDDLEAAIESLPGCAQTKTERDTNTFLDKTMNSVVDLFTQLIDFRDAQGARGVPKFYVPKDCLTMGAVGFLCPSQNIRWKLPRKLLKEQMSELSKQTRGDFRSPTGRMALIQRLMVENLDSFLASEEDEEPPVIEEPTPEPEPEPQEEPLEEDLPEPPQEPIEELPELPQEPIEELQEPLEPPEELIEETPETEEEREEPEEVEELEPEPEPEPEPEIESESEPEAPPEESSEPETTLEDPAPEIEPDSEPEIEVTKEPSVEPVYQINTESQSYTFKGDLKHVCLALVLLTGCSYDLLDQDGNCVMPMFTNNRAGQQEKWFWERFRQQLSAALLERAQIAQVLRSIMMGIIPARKVFEEELGKNGPKWFQGLHEKEGATLRKTALELARDLEDLIAD